MCHNKWCKESGDTFLAIPVEPEYRRKIKKFWNKHNVVFRNYSRNTEQGFHLDYDSRYKISVPRNA